MASAAVNRWREVFPQIAGINVGGCVRNGRRFRRKAHAHVGDPHRGWICVLAAHRLDDEMLMLHEIAHVLSGEGHTDGWRRVLLSIGGTLNETESIKDLHKRAKRPGRFSGLRKKHHPKCPCLEVRAPSVERGQGEEK